jgi:dihydroflavonol-4-reductase
MFSLITGANGFIGSHLTRFLIAQGEQVRVLIRPQRDVRSLEGLPAEFAYADLQETHSLPARLRRVQCVYHVAADYRLWAENPQDIYESNVTGTRNLLAARRAQIGRFICTSSVGTLVPPHARRLPDEQTHLRLKDMIGHYKRSRFLAEPEALEVARNGQPGVIVNPTSLVGLARHKMFVDCSKASHGLGFRPGPLEAALERAIRWYSENGYVKIPLRNRSARECAA